MKMVVLGNDAAFQHLKSSNTGADWIRAHDRTALHDHKDADALFDLRDNNNEEDYPDTVISCFIHSVTGPVAGSNSFVRINAWDGFIQNDTWEVAGTIGNNEKAILDFLGKKIIVCPDEPGFISARIIAMIINEAYFALGEKVSTETEIDTAMKLGTNYPYGPFEWAQKIGTVHIYRLLKKLSLSDARYQPAPSLAELFEN